MNSIQKKLVSSIYKLWEAAQKDGEQFHVQDIPEDKKEFLMMVEDSLSDILADLWQLLVNLTNYEGIEDDDVLFDIASEISIIYGKLTTTSLIVKDEIKDIEGITKTKGD